MLIVGLTGSLGMGKSTMAEHLRARGIAVLDADAVVHQLYEGSAAPLIEGAFPGTTGNGKVDRKKLAAALVAEPARIAELEAIVHPLVRAAERAFLRAEAERGADVAVLEIPLLFETGADTLVDVTIVVCAPPGEQRRRLLQREGVTAEKLDTLLARQMPDEQKRKRADFVVDTTGEIDASRAQLDAIVARLESRRAEAYERDWA
jgi:dephospho-CoA kinase